MLVGMRHHCYHGHNKVYCSEQLDVCTGRMYHQSEVILRVVKNGSSPIQVMGKKCEFESSVHLRLPA